MAKAEAAKWCREGHARGIIARTLHYEYGAMSDEAKNALLKALRDGDVEARLRREMDDGTVSDYARDLEPSFWAGETAGQPHVPWAEMDIGGIVEIDLHSLSNWLLPVADSRKRGPGRETKHDWDGMWIELVLRANTPDGLSPDLRTGDLAADLQSWFETSGRSVPDTRTIEKKLEPLLERLRRK